ncbi:hypothetical protein [Halobacteriovorax sp. HLS]|uniref:hypothetical protein n=1 Tax=Halobacteriovorax sp. HLS TaxID=2234000 RepID=UPI000FDBDB90|nr:hypothetical protein [Halobacteriovorax sp. HLS]
MKYFLLIFLFFIPAIGHANSFSFTIGPVEIAQGRSSVNLRDFKLKKSKHNKLVRANFVKDSVQWVRDKENLLTPRARIGLRLKESGDIFIKYEGHNIIPVSKNDHLYSEVYVNLFYPKDIEIYNGAALIERISMFAKKKKATNSTSTSNIDYSCVPFHLNITGLDGEYFSVGCRLEKTGRFGNERPRLVVSLVTTNYLLADGSDSPIKVFLQDNSKVSIPLLSKSGSSLKVSLSAKLPKKIPRLKTALGFGPYSLDASKTHSAKKGTLAPSLMIYGKYDLYESSSLRFFDALVYNKTLFNNSGIYFAYTLATAFDSRVELIPLLGAQGLSFKYDSFNDLEHQFIFPQGFEVVYRHAFGLENYTASYGMFLSTSSKTDYENIWIRMGKGWFLELNYINWKHNDSRATMWGLSVGIPFLTFF